MMLGNVLQFIEQSQVRIARPRVGANSDADAGSEHLGQRIRFMAEISVCSRAIDNRHSLAMAGQEFDFILSEVITVYYQRAMSRGQQPQVVHWPLSARQ